MELLNSENVFPFFLQYALTVRPTDAHAFLDHLKYLARSLNLSCAGLEAARAIISSKGYVNTKSPAIQFLSFINEGVEQGVFKTFTGTELNNKYVVVKNPIANAIDLEAVYISDIVSSSGWFKIDDSQTPNWGVISNEQSTSWAPIVNSQ